MQDFRFQLAFPKCNGVPAQITQFNAAFEVAFLVFENLVFPEWGIGFGQYEVSAVLVTVPEASVDENGGPVFLKDNVGRTGQFLHIEPVSESAGKQEPAHKKFGLGILAPYALHAFATLLGIHFVCHKAKVRKNSSGR